MVGVLVRVFMAVKRHHDCGNLYEGKHLIEVAYSTEVQPMITVTRSMAACRQIWYWRKSRYILILQAAAIDLSY